jgi:hypothetical protein
MGNMSRQPVSRASTQPPGQIPPDTTGHRHEQRIQALNLPARRRVSVTQLCDTIGNDRGRTILVIPTRIPISNLDGIWLSTRDGVDCIAIESRLSPVHQHGVVLHELAHLLCDHEETQVIDVDAIKVLWPSLRPEWVHRVLGRDHSDSDAERDAEDVASRLSLHTTWSPDLTTHLPPAERAVAHRLTTLLEHWS